MEEQNRSLPKKSRKRESSVFGFQKDSMLVSYVPKQNRAVILLSTMRNNIFAFLFNKTFLEFEI